VHHADLIRDQFTYQAAAYAKAQSITNAEILQRILRAVDPQQNDEVLDIACGPGILTCALAARTRHATGIDLTPAMLEEARRLQGEEHLENLTWIEGDVKTLPFADASFTLVICRYSFHHFEDPFVVLKEMKRVCRPGGRVVVIDTAPSCEKADAFNHMERLRDFSHMRALPVEETVELFAKAGLSVPSVETLRMEGDLNGLLQRSHCKPGDEKRCRKIFEDSLLDDRIDMQPRIEGGNILYAFPLAIVLAAKT
jgi:ubiquinone/menaquinone biosynthesis C-methylase UbiE